ncbi:MAG: hypothetical protein MZU79_07170 [Anaerotruncus sp.]|nr:hypothetical protein [Anaerotruncus sp.]
MAKITMLGTGLIGTFYTQTLHGLRSRDRVVNVYSRSADRARAFAAAQGIGRWTDDHAIRPSGTPSPRSSSSALPNDLHEEAVAARGRGRQGRPLHQAPRPDGRRGAGDAPRPSRRPGVFAGYLEDLVYTPKTLKALASTRRTGRMGRDPVDALARDPPRAPQRLVLGRRSARAAGRSSTWAATASRSAAASSARTSGPLRAVLLGRDPGPPHRGRGLTPSASSRTRAARSASSRSAGPSGAAWTCATRSAGTEGTIWLDHFLRTGFEMFTAAGAGRLRRREGRGPRRAGSSRSATRPTSWATSHMFHGHARRAGEAGRAPMETFHDGYVVNADHRRLLPVDEVRHAGSR